MDTYSNIRDLHEHREESELVVREPARRAAPRGTAAAPKGVASADFGSGWYHEAAIDAASREAIEARCHPTHW